VEPLFVDIEPLFMPNTANLETPDVMPRGSFLWSVSSWLLSRPELIDPNVYTP
jgi:hypothetical protein